MDTSETNILMCMKAEEIQNNRRRYLGDWFAKKDEDGHWGAYLYYEPSSQLYYNEDIIWLPLQDQLQEMSGLTWHDFDVLCWSIAHELLEHHKGYPSKEVAGLMAVQLHKFGKVWNGEDWIAA